MAQNNCFGTGGAEVFDDQRALLLRAVAIWPGRKTRQALAKFEQRHHRAPEREPPAVLVEWQAAVQAYVDARSTNTVTEAHRARAREAWAAIKDRMEPSAFALELMEEIERPLQ